MQIRAGVLAAIIGVCGLLGGSLLGFLFTSNIESSKEFRELRTRSYVDFLQALNYAGHAKGEAELHEASRSVATARSRLSAWASPIVISAAAEFFRKCPDPRCFSDVPATQDVFINLVEAIRSEIPGSALVPHTDLKDVVFNPLVPTSSRPSP